MATKFGDQSSKTNTNSIVCVCQIRMGLNGPAKLRRLRDVTLKKIGSTVPRLARLDNVEQVSVK